MMFPGFASEFYKLDERERGTLVEVLLEQTRERPDVAAIIAVQDHATILATRRAQAAVDQGADVINLLPPYQLKPPAAALSEHVSTVLAAIAPTPVILQYAPSETGTSLDARMLAQLGGTHSNLRLVKVESSPPGRLIEDLATMEQPMAAVEGYAGVQLPDAFRRGAVGTQPGCSFTEIYVEIWRLLASGQAKEGELLHTRLLPYISYWMLDTELIIAAEKRISQRRGLIATDYCRAPRHRLDREESRRIECFLEEFADFLVSAG